jgi:hypothetical protein
VLGLLGLDLRNMTISLWVVLSLLGILGGVVIATIFHSSLDGRSQIGPQTA